MKPEIIFENDDFVAINKPSGLMVHPDGKFVGETLVDWVRENYPETEGVGEPLILRGKEDEETLIARPGIVHRLDKETSGVMIVVKNQEAFNFFKDAFKNRDIHKTYSAFVWGHVKNDLGIVDAPIGRSKSDFRKWSAQRGARGEMRDAVTEYKVLSRFEENDEKFSFIETMPKTGRTHQIRVHMKYLNHPLVGDSLYGGAKPAALGFTRLALHSRRITFTGLDGKDYAFEAPYPDDFLETIAKL